MSQETPNKRVKGKNFKPEEARLLINCVNKYKDVIENKRTDGTSVELKNVAWKKLTENFNSSPLEGNDQIQPRELRTCAQLRSYYENYKRKVRKDNADDKGELYKTGGGKFVKKLDEDGERLIAMLRPQFEPDPNKFDSAIKYHDRTVNQEKSVNLISDTTDTSEIDHFDADDSKIICSPISSPVRKSTLDKSLTYIEGQYSSEEPACIETVKVSECGKSVQAMSKNLLQANKRPRSSESSTGPSRQKFGESNSNIWEIQHTQSVEGGGGNKRTREMYDTSKLDLLEIEKKNKYDMGQQNLELHELSMEKLKWEIERSKQSKKHEQELYVLEKQKIKMEIQLLGYKLKSQLNERQ